MVVRHRSRRSIATIHMNRYDAYLMHFTYIEPERSLQAPRSGSVFLCPARRPFFALPKKFR